MKQKTHAFALSEDNAFIKADTLWSFGEYQEITQFIEKVNAGALQEGENYSLLILGRNDNQMLGGAILLKPTGSSLIGRAKLQLLADILCHTILPSRYIVADSGHQTRRPIIHQQFVYPAPRSAHEMVDAHREAMVLAERINPLEAY